MTYEQIIFWGRLIFIGIIILFTIGGSFLSYKIFPPRNKDCIMWIIMSVMCMFLGMIVGMITSILIRDYWFEIYNVINPYVN